jgi:hypothetical protein
MEDDVVLRRIWGLLKFVQSKLDCAARWAVGLRHMIKAATAENYGLLRAIANPPL